VLADELGATASGPKPAAMAAARSWFRLFKPASVAVICFSVSRSLPVRSLMCSVCTAAKDFRLSARLKAAIIAVSALVTPLITGVSCAKGPSGNYRIDF
jgi:hypothetical protein